MTVLVARWHKLTQIREKYIKMASFLASAIGPAFAL
jgi:hypothetical protein